MDWPLVPGTTVLRVGLVVLFFWALVGQYVYREAKKERRSFPKLRGLCWGAVGVVGAVNYLVHIREREKKRLGWVGLAMLLFAFWAIATIGRGALDRAFRAWAALFAGVFLLYWQFHVETFDGSGRRSATE